jgi:hypothetical protein
MGEPSERSDMPIRVFAVQTTASIKMQGIRHIFFPVLLPSHLKIKFKSATPAATLNIIPSATKSGTKEQSLPG